MLFTNNINSIGPNTEPCGTPLVTLPQSDFWFSGLYSGGLTWSIVLRCDDHTGIFMCDGYALLSVTLELHSPTILFVIISGYNVPLRHFLMVCYCFSTILNYYVLRKSDVIKITCTHSMAI